MTQPAKIATRRLSRIQEEMDTFIKNIKAKRTQYMSQAKRVKEKIDSDAFEIMQKSELSLHLARVQEISVKLDKLVMDEVCEVDEENRTDAAENDANEDLILSLQVKIANRLEALNKAEQASQINDMQPNQPLRIEVQQTDLYGNIPNVWGKFNGDYSKWKSFRDLWVASMHDNEKVKTIVKFQNLKAACVGSAIGALGEWDLTEENYHKAWERLQAIYEDDYMQVQAFMKKLGDLPTLSGSSSKAIRDTIDIVQKHIHGLKRYVNLDDKHPYVVFAVISKMDTDTYRAWEKYRPSLAKAHNQNVDPNDEQAIIRPGKYIPTWSELEQFLEGEVTIRVHAEERSGTRQQNAPQQKKKQKHFEKYNNADKKAVPEFLQCVLCEHVHPLFRCPVFLDMNLVARLNHVTQNELCVRCLRKNHNGRCQDKRANNPCPKCKPENKFHNSLLCPNAGSQTHATFKAYEAKKRNHQGNDNPPKRRRYNDNQQRSDKMPSQVNKIGDWALSKESNAMKRIGSPDKRKSQATVLLATIVMRIHSSIDETVNCRAIADTGATLDCLTESFAWENELTTVRCQKRILGVTGPEIIKRKAITTIRPWFPSEFAKTVEFYIIKQLEGIYPSYQVEASKEQIAHAQLTLADPNFDVPARIDAILGAEAYASIIGADLYKHECGGIMQSTELGHIVLGKFFVKSDSLDLPVLSIVQSVNNVNNDEELQNALTKFWEIEDINKCEKKQFLNNEEKLVEKLFLKTHYREPTGRYVVTIPIKPTAKGLGASRHIAKRQFFQLEKRFRIDAELKQKYVDYMRENQKLGYMKEANEPNANEICYWIPHHPVIKKFRVVLNASAKTTNGESLNSIQLKGPKMQYDSQLQTMRFRRYKFAVMTDITKMFNRVGLNEKQWNLHRIFWRESENQPLREYVMTVVIFGEKSSSYNAVRAMIQCATDHEAEYPSAASVIKRSFYMDDGIFGCETVEELKILCKEVEFVLGLGNFSLKGWASNSPEVENHISTCIKTDVTIGENDETKILGLRWLKASDELTIKVKAINEKTHSTKREILSEIAKLYDPNGFIAPVIIKAKILMQSIWKHKETKWDDKVPIDIKNEWNEFYPNLMKLTEFKIKRWISTSVNSKIQIHAFCDASEKAYGTAIYARVNNGNQNYSSILLSAKSCVAPLKDVSIPRLELLAALMVSEQLQAVLEACEFENADVTLWSDSMVVLCWIKKDPSELKAFVGNRIREIQKRTKHYTWKHVSSCDNPADLVSRGMRIDEFLKSKFWLEGPVWLKQSQTTWPTPKLQITPSVECDIEKECKPNAIHSIYSGSEKTILYDKFQEWNKIVNITAYVLRYINIACKKNGNNKRQSSYPTAIERRQAAEIWIKYEQKKAFAKEIKCIEAGDTLFQKSEISAFRPILDEKGILRIGGRIDKANIPYGRKHQYIIPHKSRLSYLLLNYAHKATLHGGAQVMMNFIRKEFWIPKLRLEAKSYIKTCVQCVRQAQKCTNQIMAELPAIRIRPAPPFQNVGVDFAGPYNMRLTDKINTSTRMRSLPEMKGWIAVFICLVTRSVHLEAVEGLSADDFLVAYMKFTARRGNPEKIYSDNGTNFVGGNHELQKAMQSWKNDKVQRHVHICDTEWHFITPSAPHEGGIWEAAVKQMKHHLKRVIGVQKYSFQGMSALLASVEACLNSRPLCTLSEDPEDLDALTPAHFLIGRSLKLPMYEKMDKPPYSIKRLHLQLQFQIQAFWKQWSNDYLDSLMRLPKWREEQENMRIGQLVLIKADNIPPAYWTMGRVINTQKGTDGKVRSVTLKTQTGVLERSIRKTCVLPSDIELSYWNCNDASD